MKIKYAVYKGSVGLYAKEYFDKIDPELFNDRGVLGWQRIKEEDLPIVVNASGGRCSFYPVEDNFVEIIEVEEDEEPQENSVFLKILQSLSLGGSLQREILTTQVLKDITGRRL